jgi:hypothetical protein
MSQVLVHQFFRLFVPTSIALYLVGSLLEVLYELMGYGIAGIIPLGDDGQIEKEVMAQWIQRRQEIESSLISEKIIVSQPEDVLLGRGKKAHAFPGNLKFRSKIEANCYTYDKSSKFEKSVLIEMVLRSIKDTGGRFLQQGPNGYIEVEDDVARKKISHAWRNLRASKVRTVPPSLIGRKPLKQELLCMSMPYSKNNGFSSQKITDFCRLSSE